MSKVKFSSTIDLKQAKQAEVQAYLNELANWVNAPSIESEDFEPRAVHHRHVELPLKYNLGAHVTSFEQSIVYVPSQLTLNGLTYSTYYQPRFLQVDCLGVGGSDAGKNIYESQAPLGVVTAIVHLNNCPNSEKDGSASGVDSAALNSLSTMFLAYSFDGVNWSITKPGSAGVSRNPGIGNGRNPAYFAGDYNGQPHYIFGAGTPYTPFNFNYDRPIVMVSTFGPGGEVDLGANDDIYWTVLFNTSTGIDQLDAQIFADYRSNQ